jgi:hypothetical protein
MNHVRTETTWIGRIYAALIESSAAAVALHYDAPWDRPQAKRADRS